ncbi:hypothetical protein [Nostoc sp.]|uniref:hypothetical protein n=1 Tax=Nostoc sp. TaxID=1180 RepID=UPI002FF8CF30
MERTKSSELDMSELLGYSVSRQRGWEYLKEMRLRLRVPRLSHEETGFLELEEVLFNRCKQLLKQQDLVRGLTNFYWWPQVQVAV